MLTFLMFGMLFGRAGAQGFTEVGGVADMQVSRYGHMATSLPDGRVLVVGGHTQGFDLTSTAEIYDPVADTWTLFNVPNPHDGGGMVKLADGRFFFMGGCSSGSGVGQSPVTTYYDPGTGLFTNGPLMQNARFFQTAALLSSGDVLVVGNWYAAGTAERYDAVAGVFEPLGAPVTERALPLVLPCSDGSAYILGGTTVYGGAAHTSVEAFDAATGQFAQVSSEIIPGEQGWTTYWSSSMNMIDRMRRSNGNYVFMVYRPDGLGGTQYGVAQFDPVSKQFSLLALNPALPDYTGSASGPWALSITMMVDVADDLLHINVVDLVGGLLPERLYTVDLASGFLSMATGGTSFGRHLYSGSRVWVGDAILYTGGTVDGSNFNVSNATNLLLPQHTVSVREDGQAGDELHLFPHPMGSDGGWLTAPGGDLHTLRLIDASGRVCREMGIRPDAGRIRLERSGLPAGIYAIELIGPRTRRAGRVVMD